MEQKAERGGDIANDNYNEVVEAAGDVKVEAAVDVKVEVDLPRNESSFSSSFLTRT